MKEFLSFQKIPFDEFDITKDSDAKYRMIRQYSSYSTPTVVVAGHVIRGFNLEELEEALKTE